jgi:hypothetical protein
VSLRSSLWRYLGLLAVAALAVGVFAGPASAKKLSAKQRAAVRAQLRKQIKKNPKLINRKSFVKRASLVDFTLPITIKLRNSGNGVPQGAGNNPNNATLDLGASLGQREVDLGGSLAGEIQFHDTFDGGALGNVDIVLRPGPKSLTTTSIPLLWNTNVSNGGAPSVATAWDTGLATANAATGGCSNFTGASNLPFDPNNLSGSAPAGGFPGVPEYNNAGTTPTGAFVPVNPGIDDINNLGNSKTPGNINNLGGNPTPFPSGTAPGGFPATPSVKDAVLRTAPLKLQVATPGTNMVNSGTGDHPTGSQDQLAGKSGGQANLFGNIPGKSYGVDVTVSLTTQINSIFRAVDVDAQRVRVGAPWPAALFNCRQAITGSVTNYIPDVRLKGNLKISPAVTPAGDLRIAKVSLSSLAEPYPTHFPVAACLSLYSVLAAEQNSTNTTTYNVPADAPGLVPNGNLPADTSSYGRITSAQNPDFSAAGTCNSAQTQLTKDAGFTGLSLAQAANGYDAFATNTGGDKVSVAADLTVNDVEADVIIGDR